MNSTTTASPFIEAYTASSDEFYSQLYTSVPLGFILIIIYCIIRKLCINKFEFKRNESEYLILSDDDHHDNSHNTENKSKTMTHPNISSTSYFKWIYDIWKLDTNTIYVTAGFDAVVFVLFLRCCVSICLWSLPYALFVLIPIYATSSNYNESDDWLDILSLTNVPSESDRLYATLIGCYIFSFIALYYLSNTYLKIAHLTDRYLIDSQQMKEVERLSWFNYNNDHKRKQSTSDSHKLNIGIKGNEDIDMKISDEEKPLLSVNSNIYDTQVRVPPMDRYTVMLRHLPLHLRDETVLTQLMQQLFNDEIIKVVVVRDVTDLISIKKQIEYHEDKLKTLSKKHDFNINDVYNENPPQIYGKLSFFGLCGKSINLIEYHVTERNKRITELNGLQKADLKVTSTAFVVFNSISAVSSFISSPKGLDFFMVEISKAPASEDIYWQNLTYSSWSLFGYNLCIILLMSLILIFWSIPVIAIQGLANIEVIISAFGGNINLSTSTISLLQGTLTVLVLDIWLSSVPVIVDALSKVQRPSHRGRHQLLILNKYYICLVFMVLLVTVITSAVLSGADNYQDFFKNFAENIGNLANLLANGLSSMSVYFLLYILLNAFVWIPLELFRLPYFISKQLNLSPSTDFVYSVWIPKILLIFTIVLTYSVMNPIMWIFGAFYFVLSSIVLTYNLCMSWIPQFDIGPQQWVLIFELIRYSFVISIVTLYGVILLKQNYICSTLLIPLLICIWVITGKIKSKFDPLFKSVTSISAHAKDMQMKNQKLKDLGMSQKELNDLYLPPVLCIKYKQ